MIEIEKALKAARNELRRASPLIHCITNPIAINDCANAILAVGAKPIMAEHPAEVETITRSAGALGMNLGNITDARIASVRLSAAAAKSAGIPAVLDAVGVTCSDLRLNLARELLKESCPEIIKGNGAEIRALAGVGFHSRGIDDLGNSFAETAKIAQSLAKEYGCTVLVTGAVDIVTDGVRTAFCKNGTDKLALVTGTGCVVHALTTSYLAVTDPFTAALLGVSTLGVCGELAEQEFRGLGTFHMHLFDHLSTLSDDVYLRRLKVVERLGGHHAV